MIRTLLGVGAAALIALPAQAVATMQSTPPAQAAAPQGEGGKLRALFRDSDEAFLRRNPVAAIFRGDLRYADRLGDFCSDAYFEAVRTAARADLSALAQIDRASLDATDKIAYDVFKYQQEQTLAGFVDEIFALEVVRPINHFTGIHTFYPTFASGKGAAPFKTIEDYENNLKRHSQLPPILECAIGRFRDGMKSGVLDTRLTIQNVIDQLNLQLGEKPEDSPYYGPVKEFPKELSEQDHARLRAAYLRSVSDELFPSYRKLRDFLQKEYLPKAREGVGLVHMKDGRRLYDHLVKDTTTTSMTADEVHELGLKEVARIRAGMDAIRNEVGFKGTLAEFFEHLRTEPKFKAPSADWLRNRYAEIGKQVDSVIDSQFSTIPKSKLEIRPVEPFREKQEASGSYIQGTPDGSRPGVFYFNTYDLPSRSIVGVETLYLHEGAPGHHFQISLAQENTALPAFMRFGGNTAYVEGWALYAETLGPALGLFKDPYQRHGHLDDEMLRAMRLVVDTGIHAKGWTRDQAIEYMLSNSGMGRTDATAEVERYIAIPSQALAYKIGSLTIQRLKTKAQGALGSRFDPRAFHAQVLDTGALPLTVLERKIEDWIAGQPLTATAGGQDQATVVKSTRTGLRLEDQAVSVEVLGRDRIEENMLVTPGNVVRSLDEMAALRVQSTSPELGLTTIRTRGLRGQYTRLLSDGVPLYFDLPGGLAPVQIPPMDLNRIEVIPGGASALFGANALGGVVNLLSRRPGKEANREFLVSQSTPDATDVVLWMSSAQTGSWGRTFLVSGHRQNESDVNDDGWSDLPEYQRGVVRQGVFWDNGRGRSASGTAGVTFEKREGGSAIAHQALESKLAHGALFGQMPLGRFILAGAGSLFVQSYTRDFSDGREQQRRQAATIEIALRGTAPRQHWVAGIAADWFANRSGGTPAAAYIAPRGGIFVHDDVQVATWLTVAASARLDYTKGAGDAIRIDDIFFSPRASAVARTGAWAARFSADRSYFTPTALTEETEAAGFARLSIEGPLEVETARSVSADLTYESRGSAVTFTVFHSRVDDPSVIDRETYTLRTDPEPLVTRGVELRGTARRAPFSMTGTYTYVRAREGDGRDVALTPRNSAGLVASVGTGRGRVSVHAQFTGVQRLDANPYRSRSEPYTVLSVLSELRFGRWRLFLNGENLTDVRQTEWDPIARPARDVDGRWTVDAWAPLAGRVINGGLRVSF